MVTKLTHISLYVRDQEEALAFYRDKLGLKVHTDMIGEGMRWLTLHAPNQSDVELALIPANNAEALAAVGKQAPSIPFLVFESTDCQADFEALKSKGVTFTQEPIKKPWGIEAAFVDLYGNALGLYQP